MHEVKTFPLSELKVAADGPGEFEGRASTFGTIDSYGDTIVPGAYKDTIPEFIKRGFIAASHDWSEQIGYVTDAEERDDGLWVSGKFHSDPEAQKIRIRAKERVEAGRFMGLSIGYQAKSWEMREMEGREEPVRALTKVDLFEVSLVAIPAERNSGIAVVKGYGFDMPLTDHAFQLRVALEELVERFKAGTVSAPGEAKVGRAISAARRQLIEKLADDLGVARETLLGMLKDPDDEEDEPDPVVGLNSQVLPPDISPRLRFFLEQRLKQHQEGAA